MLFVLAAAASSCRSVFMESEPRESAPEIFSEVWHEFDRTYAYFEHKNINWDSIYTVYEKKISPGRATDSLGSTLWEMLSILKDGHVMLDTGQEQFNYQYWKGYPTNFDSKLLSRYLRPPLILAGGSAIRARNNVDSNIAYMRISHFPDDKSWPEKLELILEQLSNSDALIIDLRNNGGGNDQNALHFAGRFADRKRLFGYIQYRNGPKHNEFTKKRARYLQKTGDWQYLKPVAILTNRRTFSAAESVVLAMLTVPDVITVGALTGGGSGNPMTRELPNGWLYTISTWVEQGTTGNIFEGRGIQPVIAQKFPLASLGKDVIIDRAIVELKKIIHK